MYSRYVSFKSRYLGGAEPPTFATSPIGSRYLIKNPNLRSIYQSPVILGSIAVKAHHGGTFAVVYAACLRPHQSYAAWEATWVSADDVEYIGEPWNFQVGTKVLNMHDEEDEIVRIEGDIFNLGVDASNYSIYQLRPIDYQPSPVDYILKRGRAIVQAEIATTLPPEGSLGEELMKRGENLPKVEVKPSYMLPKEQRDKAKAVVEHVVDKSLSYDNWLKLQDLLGFSPDSS